MHDYATYEAKFQEIWAHWAASLGRGEGAPNFLKKDRFLAGLYLPLREKVKGRFPATYKEAVKIAREKDRKLSVTDEILETL